MGKVYIYSLCVFLCVNIAYGQLGDTCNTINDGAGTCISIESCEPYIKFLRKSRGNSVLQPLREATCGYKGKIPMVCCPLRRTPNITPPTVPNLPPPKAYPAPVTTSSKSNVVASSKVPDSSNFVDSFPTPLTCVVSNGTLICDEGGGNGKFDGDRCKTIDDGVRSCISIVSCEPYMKLLQNAITPGELQSLMDVICGFEGKNAKVCCPLQRIPDVPPPTLPTLPSPTAAPATVTTSSESNVASGKSLPDNSDLLDSFPEPPVCGMSNGNFGRVVGGDDAELGAFPWMALLGYNVRSSMNWLCGGSLISTHHVLTAAHCIHKYETRLTVVRLGELDHSREDDGATPKDFLIKYKIKHENYDHLSFANDIGLLILKERVQFTDLIKPICVPQISDLRSNSFEGWHPFLAGWGHTEFRGTSANHLQVVQLPVVSNNFCAKAYKPYKPYNSDKSLVIDDSMLCAGYKKGGKDSCHGDSGGPLMQPIFNSKTSKMYFYQIGVVSYGAGCAKAGFPGVYSRVTHFVPWLEKHVLGIA